MKCSALPLSLPICEIICVLYKLYQILLFKKCILGYINCKLVKCKVSNTLTNILELYVNLLYFFLLEV